MFSGQSGGEINTGREKCKQFLSAAAARYTVVINWRSALKYTAQAEDLIRSSGASDIAARPRR